MQEKRVQKSSTLYMQDTKIKQVNRTCTCTYVLSIWQFLRLEDHLARGKTPGASALGEPTVSSAIRHLLKD